ncbi:MAG: aldehyde dehydrogenase family protein [Bryobacterales bacterium]|nr:aldehyde dehydrogenase family protein [Bryobacterales bacterium]
MSVLEPHHNFIDGKWQPAEGGGRHQIRNPARPDEVLGDFPSSAPADVDAAVSAAAGAAKEWARMPGPQRGAILSRFAQLLESRKAELGRIVTLEMGKPLGEAAGEVGRAATEARFSAGEASRLDGHTFATERAGYSCQTVLEPLGVVAAISPWNFPVVAPVRKVAPALACGNAVVLKPASITPWSSSYIVELFESAGVPPGVVNLVIGSGNAIGNRLVDDPRVGGITFTGSTAVGIPLNERAARRLAKVQLELGGKNPAVVVDYDDLEGAAREIVSAALQCSGQRCTAISRVIVGEDQADALVQELLAQISRIRVGDGLDEKTTMGPLSSKTQLETVERYVQIGRDSSAKLLAGGRRLAEDPDRQGYFYAPTLFDHVSPDSPLALEEIFGPVLPVIRVRDFDQALEVANASRYGLAAALFTTKMKCAQAFMRTIRAGMIHINHGTASQAHVPFGGVKDSGLGAYSIGHTAKEFYTNVKAVYVKWE